MAWQVSSVVGSAYACGSTLTTQWLTEVCTGGDETLYNHADVGVPAGNQISDSGLVAETSYAGVANISVLANLGVLGCLQDTVQAFVRTAPTKDCESQRANRIVGDTPQGEIVSCLRGDSDLGYNYNWTALTDGELSMTIGPMRNDFFGVDPGLTMVALDLCGYYGDTGSEAGVCGSEKAGDQWQQKNGCGLGTYTLTGTMNNGTTVTPVAEDTVRWWRLLLYGPAPGGYCTASGWPPTPPQITSRIQG